MSGNKLYGEKMSPFPQYSVGNEQGIKAKLTLLAIQSSVWVGVRLQLSPFLNSVFGEKIGRVGIKHMGNFSLSFQDLLDNEWSCEEFSVSISVRNETKSGVQCSKLEIKFNERSKIILAKADNSLAVNLTLKGGAEGPLICDTWQPMELVDGPQGREVVYFYSKTISSKIPKEPVFSLQETVVDKEHFIEFVFPNYTVKLKKVID